MQHFLGSEYSHTFIDSNISSEPRSLNCEMYIVDQGHVPQVDLAKMQDVRINVSLLFLCSYSSQVKFLEFFFVNPLRKNLKLHRILY